MVGPSSQIPKCPLSIIFSKFTYNGDYSLQLGFPANNLIRLTFCPPKLASILVLLSQNLLSKSCPDGLYAHLCLRPTELDGFSRRSTGFRPLDREGVFCSLDSTAGPLSASWKEEMYKAPATRWRQRYFIREAPQDTACALDGSLPSWVLNIFCS